MTKKDDHKWPTQFGGEWVGRETGEWFDGRDRANNREVICPSPLAVRLPSGNGAPHRPRRRRRVGIDLDHRPGAGAVKGGLLNARRVDTGQVAVNRPMSGSDVLPIGGFKEPGSWSKERGFAGLDLYTRIKTIAIGYQR